MEDKKHILLVDDDKVNLDLLKEFLENRGYITSAVQSGQGAIDFLKENSCNLVLLDIIMPGLDGFETCVRIKQMKTAKETPIIFLTANNDHDSIIKGFQSGGVDYVTKPFNSLELLYRIDTQLKLQDRTNALKIALEEVERLATTDHLTKIFNRLRFDILLKQQIEISQRYNSNLSILFIDIDHFKFINDTFGHDVGDKVLIETVNVVSSMLRNSDIFARWGGEEFAVLTPETDLAGARILANKIKKTIENHSFEIVRKVTISIGVTELKATDDSNKFIKRADSALYNAKNDGRNRVEVLS
jgi:diguanylate cyclase (GGDEF)-like protein